MYKIPLDWMLHPKYHNHEKGCLLTLKRKEVVGKGHYVRIFQCVKCGKECSIGGWEWGWYGGTPNTKEAKVEEMNEVNK